GVLRRHAENARIMLSNPPYESFVKVGAKRYRNTDEPVMAETQAVEMMKRTLPHLPAGGVFGVVMPVGVLHDKESKPIREQLLKDFDLSEISVFADNLFEHGDHEVAVLMGRKMKPRTTPPAMMYRRVREADMAAFKERLAFSWEREVSPNRFRTNDGADLRIRELDELWQHLAARRVLRDYASVGQGLTHRADDLSGRPWTTHNPPRQGDPLGFAGIPNDLDVFDLPPLVGMNLDPQAIARPRHGLPSGAPQVLLNYAPVSRKAWRLKATLDEAGRALNSRLLTVRPHGGAPSPLYHWAILNSPVANAFAYDIFDKRAIPVGILRKMPVPQRSSAHESAVEQAAARYRELAIAKAAATPSATDLFDQKAPPVAPPPTDAEVRDALLAMDAAVLRAYALPVRLERQLLDLFNGAERKGVGCAFGNYYPADFKSLVPLHKYISAGYRGSTVDQVAARMRPDGSSAGTAALRAAAEAFGGDDDKAARYARASALLDKWANEDSDFDARVEPIIDKFLRDSAPRHFPKP
ncbi:MAG TPA: N-6 DNA methylase, partial [Mycobacterium sp.]